MHLHLIPLSLEGANPSGKMMVLGPGPLLICKELILQLFRAVTCG